MSKKITIEEVRKYFKNLDCNLISKEYKNFKSNLEFICNKHKDKGVQLNSYRNARRGLCCHYCGKENSINSRKISEKELEKITENAGFIFVGTELINHKRKIIYKCKKHIDKGEQNAEVANMRKSNGNCPYCLNRCRTTESFKQEMKVINPNIEIIGEYINVHTKIKCKCNIDGYEWDALPHNLINGEGCRKCFVKRNSLNNTHTQEWFNSIMNILHPDIEVLSPFVKMQEKVKCKCKKCEYEWNSNPKDLKHGTGCPICKQSHGEECINRWLKQNNIYYFREYRFSDCIYKRTLPFDFYLPDYNLCIEYQGEQHYRPVTFNGCSKVIAKNKFEMQKIKDKIKKEYCINNGISFLEISYKEFNHLEKILESKILKYNIA